MPQGSCYKPIYCLFFFNYLYFFLIYLLFIYYFIFGCVGSLSLCEGFLQLQQAGATLHHDARASHYRGLSCCGAQAPDTQAQQLWLTGPVAPRHVGSSQTRARTRVPCIGRQIVNHCTTGKPSTAYLLRPVRHRFFNISFIKLQNTARNSIELLIRFHNYYHFLLCLSLDIYVCVYVGIS